MSSFPTTRLRRLRRTSPLRSLVRETRLDLGQFVMPLFVCRRWKGVPTGRENQTLAWVRASKLTEYEMPPADKPLIPLLRDFL